MKNKILGLIAVLLITASTLSAQTKVIAHRGFWDTEGSAQNSIAALSKAYEIAVYGAEFDVLVTSDGVPVINHDNTIQGFDIQEMPYKKLKDLKLSNGETLPTLEEYLSQGKEYSEMQLVLEIKSHKTKKAEDKAVAIIVNLVKKMHLEDQVEYISFSMNACKELLRLSPDSQIAYLTGDLSPTEIHAIGLTGIDYHYDVFTKNPEWIDEARMLGLTINVWTVNKEENMINLIEKGVDFITTDKPLEVQKLLEDQE